MVKAQAGGGIQLGYIDKKHAARIGLAEVTTNGQIQIELRVQGNRWRRGQRKPQGCCFGTQVQRQIRYSAAGLDADINFQQIGAGTIDSQKCGGQTGGGGIYWMRIQVGKGRLKNPAMNKATGIESLPQALPNQWQLGCELGKVIQAAGKGFQLAQATTKRTDIVRR